MHITIINLNDSSLVEPDVKLNHLSILSKISENEKGIAKIPIQFISTLVHKFGYISIMSNSILITLED